MLSGHTHAPLERLRTQEVVWLGQDTTLLPYGTTPPKAGRGTVKITTREASLRHPPVAFTPARVHGGVGGMQGWPRPEQPVGQQRKRQPMAEQERDRWREGSQCACKVKQACPATLGVTMADRAGDSQAWLVDARRRAPAQRAEGIMRAKCQRRLAPGAGQRYGWAERPQTSAGGTRTLARARQPARPPRPLTLAITPPPVTFQGARRLGGTLPPVTVSAVEAQEPSPPQGEAPVAW